MRIILIILFCPLCFAFSPTISNFNGGQVSPLLETRVNFPKYTSSCRTLENMLVTVHGPAVRRPGTKYIATQKDSAAIGRLTSYEHSVDDAYVLLFEDQVLRFFRDGGQILDVVGTEDISALDNIIAHWLLNETEGVTVVDDDGGTHNGTATADISLFAVDGNVNGAFDLDGQYVVSVDDSDDFSFTDNSNDTPFSIACWGFVTQQSDLQILLSKWRNVPAQKEWRFSLTSDQKLQLHLADTGAGLFGDVVSQWKLNENAGNTSVVDAVGLQNGVSTTNTSTLSATSKNTGLGTCFDFDGQYAVEINDNASYSFGNGTTDSPFSIAAWIYVVDAGIQTILSKYDLSTSREWKFFNWLSGDSGGLWFTIYDESQNSYRYVDTDNPLGAGWHFVVATYNGVGGNYAASEGIILYVDNVMVAQSPHGIGTPYVAMENTATKVVIGGAYDNNGNLYQYYGDKIDNVVLFDKELTQAEITSLWSDGDGIEDLSGAVAQIFSIADSAITLGWHFFAATYSAPADEAAAADGIILYVDGVAVNSTAANDTNYTAMQNTTRLVKMGAQLNIAGSDYEKVWGDKIDEVSIFGDVLTPTEVASLFSATPYEIETPYTTSDLPGLDFIKSEGSMYIAHADYEPTQLTRIEHALWTLTAIQADDGPFQAENEDTDLTITPSAATGDITLTAASDLFSPRHINSIWRIEQVRDTSQLTGTFTANGISLSTPFFSGAYSFTTSGSWTGTITLQRSTNGGISWRPALTVLTDTNFDNPAEVEEEGAIYRIVMSNYGSDTATYTFSITDNLNKGVIRITGVESGTVAIAEVIADLVGTTATSNWREGYWSDYRGWPETVAIHQQRLVFGGSRSFPQTIWFGKTDPDDYTNFTEGTLDTSAFTVALAGNNPIQWMLSQDSLLIGTSGSCGKWGEAGKAVTPTSPAYQDQTPHGSAAVMAVRGGDNILYVERGARNVRGFGYNFQQNKHLSSDLSVLSPEITESGIKEMAFQLRPELILWCILNNGDIATLTYQRDQLVVAWTKQITDGNFESIAVIPSPTGTEDQVWVSVERTIDSNSVRYVELFMPRDWGSDDNDAWFVDSGISYDGSSTDTFTGAEHLEAETVSIYADLLIESPEVVSGGGFTIDNAASRVLVGMAYTSKLETLPLVIDPQDRAANKKVKSVWFDLYKTGYMEYGGDPTATLINMDFNNNLDLDPDATAQDFVTSTVDLKRGNWSWGSKVKQTIYVESDQPMPLTIRSITTSFSARMP